MINTKNLVSQIVAVETALDIIQDRRPIVDCSVEETDIMHHLTVAVKLMKSLHGLLDKKG